MRWGQNTKLKVVMLPIKLKGMKCTATYKQYLPSHTHTHTRTHTQKVKISFFSGDGHVAYQIPENEA